MSDNKEKKSFYKTNLKYVLGLGFSLKTIYDKVDDFGSRVEVYLFDYDLHIPTKTLFYVDLQLSTKFKELVKVKRGQ